MYQIKRNLKEVSQRRESQRETDIVNKLILKNKFIYLSLTRAPISILNPFITFWQLNTRWLDVRQQNLFIQFCLLPARLIYLIHMPYIVIRSAFHIRVVVAVVIFIYIRLLPSQSQISNCSFPSAHHFADPSSKSQTNEMSALHLLTTKQLWLFRCC